MTDIVELDDSTWEEAVEKGDMPAAVMFYSPTCAYCAEIEPYFVEFAQKFGEKMVFAKLNVMGSSTIAGRYGVMSTPTFKFFCNGLPVQELVGSTYPPVLRKAIADVLERGSECAEKSTKISYDITGYA